MSPFVGQIYGYVLTDATKHKETKVRTQALSTKSVFFACKMIEERTEEKRRRKKEEKRKKEEEEKRRSRKQRRE